jgi:hypothetical protein
MKSNVKKLIGDIVEQCLKNNCSIQLFPKKYVNSGGIKCSGFYDEDSLMVAAGKKEWLDVLIHESCHLDQHMEKVPCWENGEVGIILIDSWLLKKKNVSKQRLEKSIKDTILLELDCEIRTVKKMQKYKIQFNKEEYIQKANSYLFSYWATLRDKKWFKFPYENKKIYKNMPKKFLERKVYLNDYEKFLSLYI